MKKYLTKIENIDADDPEWAAIFSGYFATIDKDRANDITLPSAFNNTMPRYMENPVLLLNHSVDNIIGQVLDYDIDDKGVWIKAGVQGLTALGRDIAALIKAGILKTMSFAYDVIDADWGRDGAPNILKEVELYEISVVTIPANTRAIISEAKKKGINLDEKTINIFSLQGGRMKGEKQMTAINEIAALEKKVDEFLGPNGTVKSTLEKAEERLASMQKTINDLHDMQRLSKEKVAELEQGLITKSEFITFSDRVKKDLENALTELEKAKSASRLVDTKIGWKEWHSNLLSGQYKYLRDDNARPLSELHQKAYHYFQASVDYKSSPDGEFLRKMRDAYDACLFTYQYFLGRKKQINIQSLKSYQFLHQMMEYIDPEFAKAMYSTGSGLGDEWVPTLASAELMSMIRLQPNLANYFPQFNMPSNPYEWPIVSSGATAYLAAEAAINNPVELSKSDIGTGKITFNANIHAVAVPVSPELIEDAIVDLVGEIRSEIATALNEGMEKAIINGDTTAIHRDTNIVTDNTYDIRKSFMGLRFIAIDSSKTFDTQSTTAGVGDGTTAFAAKDVRYTRQLMGDLGVNPRESLYITSISPFFYILSMSEFAKANEFGYVSTWYSGELPIVDGCELYVSANFPETMGTTGLGNTASNRKGILCCNRTKFKIGERRGITVEFEKNIRTQQWTFVATRRTDFQKMTPSTKYPVAYGYNIA